MRETLRHLSYGTLRRKDIDYVKIDKNNEASMLVEATVHGTTLSSLHEIPARTPDGFGKHSRPVVFVKTPGIPYRIA
ncbi:conserved protein of unknown function [Nitrospira defluvii]|uniref:Uncharacterized protein n=1 Tax=Nitrospira defluvii TaxID=330214 RepID=D8PH12_9BACT|nr:conserved protein of unknown function [Nitrospira defluvii]